MSGALSQVQRPWWDGQFSAADLDPIRTLPRSYFEQARIKAFDPTDHEYTGRTIDALGDYQFDWGAVPQSMRSKYNTVEANEDGSFTVVLQQPGRHKYDLMRLRYRPDGRGGMTLDGDPTQARATSSRDKFIDHAEKLALVALAPLAASAAFPTGAVGAAPTGTASTVSSAPVGGGLKSAGASGLGGSGAGLTATTSSTTAIGGNIGAGALSSTAAAGGGGTAASAASKGLSGLFDAGLSKGLEALGMPNAAKFVRGSGIGRDLFSLVGSGVSNYVQERNTRKAEDRADNRAREREERQERREADARRRRMPVNTSVAGALRVVRGG